MYVLFYFPLWFCREEDRFTIIKDVFHWSSNFFLQVPKLYYGNNIPKIRACANFWEWKLCVCARSWRCVVYCKKKWYQLWREPDDELICRCRISKRKTCIHCFFILPFFAFHLLFQMRFLSKRKKYLRYRYVLMKQNVKEYLWLNMARLHDMLHSLITLWKSEYN